MPWGELGGTHDSHVVGVAFEGRARAGVEGGRGAIDARLDALVAAATGPANWREIESANAEAKWSDLRGWVDWFRREFAFDHRVVPPCWYRHPALVSLLSALRDHWLCAYDSLNSPAGSSEWHRGFMQLEPRLREWASRTGCAIDAHRPDVMTEYPDDDPIWKAHVVADVEARRVAEAAAEAADLADRLDDRLHDHD